jgi:hypothetical protein
MNFETKYLIRWGIPGWVLIMILGPFLFFNFKEISDVTKTTNFVALVAFLTVIGVPLGYLLNQIHHSLTWVLARVNPIRWGINKLPKKRGIPYESWEEYFTKELILDKYFFKDDIGMKLKERYQYLLSRKHELGGLTISLGVSWIVILIINIIKINMFWQWLYFVLIFLLFFLILFSRNYSSRNIDAYFKEYLKEASNYNYDNTDKKEKKDEASN